MSGSEYAVKLNHGGLFKKDNSNRMVYSGGKARSVSIDPDVLCGFDIAALAKECGPYEDIHGVYYLEPGRRLDDGLYRVFDDVQVREVSRLIAKYRSVELYVQHTSQMPISNHVLPIQNSPTQTLPTVSQLKVTPKRPSKLTPQKKIPSIPSRKSPRLKESSQKLKSQNELQLDHSPNLVLEKSFNAFVDFNSFALDSSQTNTTTHFQHIPTHTTKNVPTYYQWEDERAYSPPLWKNFLGPPSGYTSDESDGEYEPEDELDSEDVELEEEAAVVVDDEWFDDEIQVDDDTSDEEVRKVRSKTKGFNDRLVELAQRVTTEAIQGILSSQVDEQETDPSTQRGDGYVSEYFDSDDDLDTPPDSGEDDDLSARRERRSQCVGPNTDFANFKWKVGQRFPTRAAFKEAVAKYVILQGRNLGVRISNKSRQQRIGVGCSSGCPFRLYASWHSKKASYMVKTVVGEHNCVRTMRRPKQLITGWMARQLLNVFKAKPHWPAKDIIKCIRLGYKVLVKRGFAYKVKYRAHLLLRGSMKEHYMKVGRYMKAITVASPATHVELVTVIKEKNPVPIFQRLFFCFDALKQGWLLGCRKVICIDSCFLKTFLGGQLMVAVGRDENDQMFPLAWSVVEGENNNSWEWFLTKLQMNLNLGKGEGLIILLDEHLAILNRVTTVLPQAEHRHCARHIFVIWHKTYKGDEFKYLFWSVVKSYNMADYNEKFKDLAKVSKDAADDFIKLEPKLFCRAYLSTEQQVNVVTNNMAETFNGYIIAARSKHLLDMCEDIRAALMQRFVFKRQEVEKWNTPLCPRIQAKLEVNKHLASQCTVLPSSSTLFQVHYELDILTVDLERYNCTCRRWQMCGYPCAHGVAAIFFANKMAEDFVHDWYKNDLYLQVYSNSIPPIEGDRHWPDVHEPLDPPPITIGPGRPRKNRIRDPHEDPKKKGHITRHGMDMTCSICKVKGHNKRRCPNRHSTTAIEAEPQVKRPRGRPKKSIGPSTSTAAVSLSQQHHQATPVEKRIGRGGRVILQGGRGRGADTRGGGRGGRAGRGKGRGARLPVGTGVLFGDDGSVMTNEPGRGLTILGTQESVNT